MERIGRERIAFMIRTDAPVRTDKFDYDEDEHLAVNEFESRHICGNWYLACTKSESAWIYALLVDSDELNGLQELASKAKSRGAAYPPLARYLRELESRQIAFPSSQRPPTALTRFLRRFPDEEVMIRLSQFVVLRCMDRRDRQEILAVNYVNGRVVRRPSRERPLLVALAEHPMKAPLSPKPFRRQLERLLRLGIVTVQEPDVFVADAISTV
jgi:hypothetical protein